MADKTKSSEPKSKSVVDHLALARPSRPMTEAERLAAMRRSAQKLDVLFGCVHPAFKH